MFKKILTRKHLRNLITLFRQVRNQKGFTIMEIMIVLLIITILATSVTVAVLPQLAKAKARTTCVRMAAVLSAAEMYMAESGECPSLEELKKSLKGEPRDAWDQEFKIECSGEEEVRVISAGKDKNFGTDDDLGEEKCREITKKK
ncbi:MAG: prepilin-type N-terminal cleavage/methylation domain-containing protein [Candidatus Omnitrophica bacterium]|nr:prepilin-type N-terminal cleavage/methylation domain-containing protein [Candidatus Omnitrophota bacterium]